MKALGKIKFVIDKFSEIVCVLILALMTCMVSYQVFARFILHNPNAITQTLSQYLFVWLIMFGSAYVFGVREHLTIDLLRDKFSPKMELVTEIACNIVLAIFILLVCIYGGWNYTRGQVLSIDPALLISKSILYISQPITGVFTLFYCVYNTLLAFGKYKGTVEENNDGSGNSLV